MLIPQEGLPGMRCESSGDFMGTFSLMNKDFKESITRRVSGTSGSEKGMAEEERDMAGELELGNKNGGSRGPWFRWWICWNLIPEDLT